MANSVVLSLDKSIFGEEAYKISVDNKFITIKASTSAGLFYGIQTIRKSLPTVKTSEVDFPGRKIRLILQDLLIVA